MKYKISILFVLLFNSLIGQPVIDGSIKQIELRIHVHSCANFQRTICLGRQILLRKPAQRKLAEHYPN